MVRVLTTIRKGLYLLNRDGLYRWFVILVVAAIAAVFEMVSAVLVFLVVGLAANPTAPVKIPIVGDVRTLVPEADAQSFLLWLLAAIALLFVVGAGIQIGATYLRQRVAHNAGARLSGVIVDGYLRSPYPLYLKRDSAELIRNGHQAVATVVARVFLPLIVIAVEAMVVTAILVALAVIAPLVTAVALTFIVILGGAVLLVVQPRLHALGRTTHEMNRKTLGTLQESFLGIRDVKALAAERFFSERYNRYRLRLARATYLASTMRQVPRVTIETGLIVMVLAFLAISSAADAGLSEAVPLVGMFAYAGIRLLPSIQKLIAASNDIRFSSAPLDDIHADLVATMGMPRDQGGVAPLRFERELRLRDVTYRYDGADDDALTQISLSIKYGEIVGICGPTGGGKTTLVDLLTGFLEPTSGTVLVDGVSLEGHYSEWLLNLGIVPQMGFLLDDTLLRNIALGVPDEKIDFDAVREAVQIAQLDEYVGSLPEGLDTMVGERGIRISGGQRQRITIARALYRRPSVLVLDEGTSALDSTTETRLMASIDALRGSHTVVVVAHRLSTIQDSDLILYIDQGCLRGRGTYDDLLKTNAEFRAFAAPR